MKKQSYEKYFDPTAIKLATVTTVLLCVFVAFVLIGMVMWWYVSFYLGNMLFLIGGVGALAAYLVRSANQIPNAEYDGYMQKLQSELPKEQPDGKKVLHTYDFALYEDNGGKYRYCSDHQVRTDCYCTVRVTVFRNNTAEVLLGRSYLDGKTNSVAYSLNLGALSATIKEHIAQAGAKYPFQTVSVKDGDALLCSFPVPRNNYNVEEMCAALSVLS